MGHPTEIFLSPPPDSSTCAICHDVLQDAVSMKECGHTFCDGCAKTCLQTTTKSTCPNCRVEVTGCNPNFFARESIGAMQVKCPHGRQSENDEEESKRRRGNDGEALPAESECCGWTGRCEDFENHDKACEFKIITCELDGCDHKCRRRDMDSHLSGGGFLRHMNLMKQSNDRKMQEMKQSITTRYEHQIHHLQEKVRNLEESKTRDEERQSASKIEVIGCGINGINGIYKKCGVEDGAPMYSKRGYWKGKSHFFTLYRVRLDNGSLNWCISEETCLFYLCMTNSFTNVPPMNNWYIASAGQNSKGVDPAPRVQALFEK